MPRAAVGAGTKGVGGIGPGAGTDGPPPRRRGGRRGGLAVGIALLLCCGTARAEGSHGEVSGTEAKPRSGWAALPVVTYSPETELGLGAFAARFFRFADSPVESRPSSVAAVALLTTRKQAIFELIPELYWDDERYRLWAKLDYRHFPNSLWGVGNDMPDSARERYLESGPRLQTQLRRRMVDAVFLEARLDAQYMYVGDAKSGGLLDGDRVPGADAGRVVGAGATVSWDTRNHGLVPSDGGFYELVVMQYTRLLGSEYNFTRSVLNLRRFLPIWGAHVLAIQLYFEASLGDTPFYRLAMIGGQRLLRGYFEGRYRDRYMLAAQAEYRVPLFWRLGAVAFLGTGDVAPRLGSFGGTQPRWSVGGGLRFALNRAERLNLRVDVGAAIDSWGLYVGVAEAF